MRASRKSVIISQQWENYELVNRSTKFRQIHFASCGIIRTFVVRWKFLADERRHRDCAEPTVSQCNFAHSLQIRRFFYAVEVASRVATCRRVIAIKRLSTSYPRSEIARAAVHLTSLRVGGSDIDPIIRFVVQLRARRTVPSVLDIQNSDIRCGLET